MTRDSLEQCKSLLERGETVPALVRLTCLWRIGGIDGDTFQAFVNEALENFSKGRAQLHQQFLRWIGETDAPEEIDACMYLLAELKDYAAIDSCRDIPIKADASFFHIGYEHFVNNRLVFQSPWNEGILVGKNVVKGVTVKLATGFGAYLALTRDEAGITTPVYPPTRRLDLGQGVWAAGYDPATDRYIVTLPGEDKVLGIDAGTLKVDKEIKSPKPGLRGLAIDPGLRRGFFNSEFGGVMLSFDLDGFEIRKEITGLGFRPERIYVDPATHVLVTGNLGVPAILPNAPDFQKFKTQKQELGGRRPSRAVSVVNGEDEEVTDTLIAGRRPTAVDISENYIAAGNFYDNTVTVFERKNPGRGRTVSVNLLQDVKIKFSLTDGITGKRLDLSQTYRSRMVEGIAILERRGWILVSGFDACLLFVIDIGKGEAVDMIPVQNRPFDVVADENEKLAYVSCLDSGQVSVVDLDAGREICRLETGKSPQDMTLAGDKLLVPHASGMTIHDTIGLAERTG